MKFTRSLSTALLVMTAAGVLRLTSLSQQYVKSATPELSAPWKLVVPPTVRQRNARLAISSDVVLAVGVALLAFAILEYRTRLRRSPPPGPNER